jgi:hypothetical protein
MLENFSHLGCDAVFYDRNTNVSKEISASMFRVASNLKKEWASSSETFLIICQITDFYIQEQNL